MIVNHDGNGDGGGDSGGGGGDGASNTFGANLKAARMAAGLTQEALAERLGFKRASPLSIWETGAKMPGPKTIIKLAGAIGCDTTRLMNGVVSPYDQLRSGLSNDGGGPITEQERRLLHVFRKLSPAVRGRMLAFVDAASETAAPLPRAPRATSDADDPSTSRTSPPRRRQ